MKTKCLAAGALSGTASLLTVSLLWGAEPAGAVASKAQTSAPAASAKPPAVEAASTAPAGGEAVSAEAVSRAPAETETQPPPPSNYPASPTVSPPASPPAIHLATSPNSVESSPYGTGAPESAASNPAPAPAPRRDTPATLFDSGVDYAIGGFGGVGVMYTRFNGSDKPLVCGEGAVIIDHKLTLGGGGCGVAAMMNAEAYGSAPHSTGDRLTFGYGGAIGRYHFFSREAVNLAVGGLIGAGGITIQTWKGSGSRSDPDNYSNKSQDPVFVFEPQIGGFVNITRWLRLAAIGGYRFISGVDVKGLRSKDLMGPTLGAQIQGGWF